MVMTEMEQKKAEVFVGRLLQNPALGALPVLDKEEQILAFLNGNVHQLLPTLSSANFFPGKEWHGIFGLLYEGLVSITNETLSLQIDDVLGSIDFRFIGFLREQASTSACKDQVSRFLVTLLQNFEARRAFSGPFTAVRLGLVDRYIDQAYFRKEYISFELLKIQRLKMSKEEVKNYLKVALLLRSAVHMFGSSGAVDAGMATGNNPGLIPLPMAQKVMQALSEPLNTLPPEVLKCSIMSNLSFPENLNLETISRLAAVFAVRGKNYKVVTKLDRGADSPDKSWFFVARRNFKFYGFDVKMLDELYRISAENGW